MPELPPIVIEIITKAATAFIVIILAIVVGRISGRLLDKRMKDEAQTLRVLVSVCKQGRS